MKVVVAGAGIGGLLAARALAQRGHAVVLVERATAFRPVGAGIILATNALATLDALGLDVRPAGRRLGKLDIVNEAGAVISPLVLPEGGPLEACSFHRAELHERLVAALPPSVEVRLGVELDAIEVGAAGTALRFTDGSHLHVDLVIGADGAHSRVRAALHPEAKLRYSGQTCWRTVVPAPDLAGTSEAWGQGGHRFGTVPLRDGRAYLFLVSPAEEGAPTPPWAELAARFGAFGGDAARVWPGVRAEGLVHHDLHELDAPVWGTPRAWLLGDAAHAMTPNLGQGAAMAIEDVGALALHLGEPLEQAHAAWVADRSARVARVHAESARMGRMAALTNPALRWMRDTAFRLTPPSVGVKVMRALVAPGQALAGRVAGPEGQARST